MFFKDIIGQEKAKRILQGQLKSGRIAHAYLLLGQDGIGRKKTAFEFAKTLNCAKNISAKQFEPACGHCVSCKKIESLNHPDVTAVDFKYQANLENKEVEKQRALKIDTIRAMQKEVSFKPSEGRWKIFIVEPAEKITLDAANCLLKTLEEPPAWTVIFLLAKHKENLPSTVVSRTQVIYFSPLPENSISEYLISGHSIQRTEAEKAAHLCDGSISNALSLLENNDSTASSLWRKLKNSELCGAELLFTSQQLSKNAQEALSELLNEAKIDFRAGSEKTGSAIEEISISQKLLEKNVNPQMVLDVLFLKLRPLIAKYKISN